MSDNPNYPPQQQQPGQWQPANPPAPPVKQQSWFMRHKIITGILGLVVVGGAMSALGGGGDTPSAALTEPTTVSSPATGAKAGATPAAKPAKPAAEKPKVDPDDVGNEANPVTVVEGKAFDVRKFSYAPGWKITSNEFGMELKNLKVTNNRDKRDSALVTFKFMKGNEVLTSIDCSSDPILQGQTVTLNCFGTDPKPKGYDRLAINDMF